MRKPGDGFAFRDAKRSSRTLTIVYITGMAPWYISGKTRIDSALITGDLNQHSTDPVRGNRPNGSSSKGIILPQMTLTSGNRLGPYKILGPLGVGGMGEVYRARDAKLGRNVALKVLPEAFARDGERMARFEREAKVLASLNHPNIASIYGLEDSGATHALVMELIEGQTLAERLKSNPPTCNEALAISCQVADALETAH